MSMKTMERIHNYNAACIINVWGCAEIFPLEQLVSLQLVLSDTISQNDLLYHKIDTAHHGRDRTCRVCRVNQSHSLCTVPSFDASSFIDDAPINVGPDQNLNQPLMNHDSTHSLPDLELSNSCAAFTRPQRNRCLPARLMDYELYF